MTDTKKLLSYEQLNSANLDKYKIAGEIASKSLNLIIPKIVPNAIISELCKESDDYILSELDKIYKKLPKGIAFPTSISKNHMAGYFSPLLTDPIKIEDGDLIKIELGVHIDGFPALIAYTVLVTESSEKITDKRANVLTAVAEASRKIAQIMKTKKTNTDVRNILTECAEKYNCNLLSFDSEHILTPGIFSYQISQNVINGENDSWAEDVHQFILAKDNPNYSFTQIESAFEKDEVYAIDIAMSTGSGKIIERDYYTTIYQRDPTVVKNLRVDAGRFALSKFTSKFPQNVRDEFSAKMKLGASVCMSEQLIKSYPVLCEKPTEYIAQVKFTVIIRDSKPILISGISADPQLAKVSVLNS
jgi:curved DNA binding protein